MFQLWTFHWYVAKFPRHLQMKYIKGAVNKESTKAMIAIG
jgi:hypothetical protein